VIVNEKHSAAMERWSIALSDGSSATVKKFYRDKDGRNQAAASQQREPDLRYENAISIPGIGRWGGVFFFLARRF